MSLSICGCVFHFNFSLSDSLSLLSLSNFSLGLPKNNGDLISSSLSLMATTMETAQFRAGFIIIFFKKLGTGSHVFPSGSIQEFQPCLATHGGDSRMANIQAVWELKQQCQQVQPQTEYTNAAFTDVVPISFRMPQEKYPMYQHLALDEFLHLLVEVDNYILYEICPRRLLKHAMGTSTSDSFKPDFQYKKLYTFTKRLENRRLLCKQRVNGKLDIYYKHDKSDKFFRSMVEVVNFIMYEICPRHLVKIARVNPMAEPSKAESKRRSRSTAEFSHNNREREIKTTITQKEAVKAFLK